MVGLANTTGRKFGGRVKGTPNKCTVLVKDALALSFTMVGAADYLVKLAQDEPKAYAMLLAKLIPSEITASINGDLKINVVSGIEAPPGSGTIIEGNLDEAANG